MEIRNSFAGRTMNFCVAESRNIALKIEEAQPNHTEFGWDSPGIKEGTMSIRWKSRGRAEVGCVGVSQPHFLQKLAVIFWHVYKSWHNNHNLLVILGRIELNLPTRISPIARQKVLLFSVLSESITMIPEYEVKFPCKIFSLSLKIFDQTCA